MAPIPTRPATLTTLGGGGERGYEIFRDQCDVELQQLSFWNVLVWVYFHSTEFADCRSFRLRAIERAMRPASA